MNILYSALIVSTCAVSGCAASSSPTSAPHLDAAAPPEPADDLDSGQNAEDSSAPIVAPGCEGRGYLLSDLQAGDPTGLHLHILEASPETPIVGNNAWLVALQSHGADLIGGAPNLTATPFMPDHGHGTAVTVQIEEEEPGHYLLAPINLRMPGYWEITLSQTSDAGTEELLVPVCVE